MDFSRLTGKSFCSSPTVQFNVSRDTSTVKLLAARAMTVRQAPLTAMLSPSCTSLKSSVLVAISRRSPPSRSVTAAICPTSAIMPLNMFHPRCDSQVCADLPYILPVNHHALLQICQLAKLCHATCHIAQQLRGDIQQQLIHQPGTQ